MGGVVSAGTGVALVEVLAALVAPVVFGRSVIFLLFFFGFVFATVNGGVGGFTTTGGSLSGGKTVGTGIIIASVNMGGGTMGCGFGCLWHPARSSITIESDIRPACEVLGIGSFVLCAISL